MGEKTYSSEYPADISLVRRIFSAHEPGIYGTREPSAVLIPLIEQGGVTKLVLTRRALSLPVQPGDICFPGGHREGAETPEETAVRETCEELGVRPENIEILGRPDYLVTKYDTVIVPVIGRLIGVSPEDIAFSPDEVSETVLIPLDWFLRTEPQIYTVPLRWMFPDDFPFDKIMNGRNYQMGRVEEAQFFYEYDGTVVWGITARIIRNLVEIIREAAR